MKTIQKVKLPVSIQQEFAYTPNVNRTIEWLGGVSFDNLERTLGNIKLLMLESSSEEIHLLVNSFGGATGIGLSFYDAITCIFKPNLTTVGSGDVDSSGVIIFLSGKKRFVTKNTTLLLHLGGRTFGTDRRFSTHDIENILIEDKLKDYHYASVVSAATEGKYSPEDILALMKRHTVLTADEAVMMGLAHKVL